MLLSIQKARAGLATRSNPSVSGHVPGIFKPPLGGSAYYGRAYRYQQVLAYRHWVFVAINAWIREIAGGEGPMIGSVRKRTGNKAVRKSLGGPKSHQEFEPYDEDHPLVRLFSNPNGPDVAYDLWANHTLFKKLTGEAHWWLMRNRLDVPVEAWVIPTHWMQLETDRDGQPASYLVQSPWGTQIHVPYDEVVSFYEHSPLNRFEGAAVSQAIAEWIDSYESMIRMRLAVWKNGAVPSFHVALGEAYMDPDEQFLARFYSKWFARFQGENNSGLPIITGADVEIKALEGHRPADALAASNDTEEHIRNQVLAAYGVPKAVVGLTDSMTYGSVESSKDAFREFSVNAELVYTGQVLTEKVVRVTPGCEKGILYWNDRMAGDPDYRLREQAHKIANGIMTVNEARAENGQEAYPHGGNDPMVNGVVMSWQTGQHEEAPLEQAFERAMHGDDYQRTRQQALGEMTGAGGGYLTNGRH